MAPRQNLSGQVQVTGVTIATQIAAAGASSFAARTVAPAIPWKRGHFPLADSCDFGSSSDYRTPVHL
jgi:hypothetical protein